MTLPAEVREYAETPDRFALLGADVERFDDGRVCILQGAAFASVSGLRVPAAELEAVLAEVRARVPAAKRPIWWLGPSTEPDDAYERLTALGLRTPKDRVGLLHALTLTGRPPVPPAVEVRRVETVDDFVHAREVLWEAFGRSEEDRERERPHLVRMFEAHMADGALSHFLAFAEGRPAATASSVHSTRGSFLIGGATAPWARGRGLYRALVHARWQEAAARGLPTLVTHAVPDTSYPILRSLGFEEVCTIRRLEDSGY